MRISAGLELIDSGGAVLGYRTDWTRIRHSPGPNVSRSMHFQLGNLRGGAVPFYLLFHIKCLFRLSP